MSGRGIQAWKNPSNAVALNRKLRSMLSRPWPTSPQEACSAIKDPMPNSVVAGTFFYRVEPEHPITHPDVAAPKVADGIVQPVEDATRASTSGARSMLPEPVNVSLLTRMFSPAGKGAQCVGVPAI